MSNVSRRISTTTLAQFARFACSCAVALGSKLGTMWLCLKLFPAMVSYLIVQVVVFFVSYLLHTFFSFKSQKLSSGTMWRYFTTVISFKVVDYLVFSVIFAYLQINAMAAVLIASLLIMLVRFAAVRKALIHKDDHVPDYANEAVYKGGL
jgi:putative flippase GtrA